MGDSDPHNKPPIQSTQRVDTVSFKCVWKYTQESYEAETKTQHCKRL